MVAYDITVRARFYVPRAVVREGERTFRFPNGSWLKPWVVMEQNDALDLPHSVLEHLGCMLDHGDVDITLGVIEDGTEPGDETSDATVTEHRTRLIQALSARGGRLTSGATDAVDAP